MWSFFLFSFFFTFTLFTFTLHYLTTLLVSQVCWCQKVVSDTPWAGAKCCCSPFNPHVQARAHHPRYLRFVGLVTGRFWGHLTNLCQQLWGKGLNWAKAWAIRLCCFCFQALELVIFAYTHKCKLSIFVTRMITVNFLFFFLLFSFVHFCSVLLVRFVFTPLNLMRLWI